VQAALLRVIPERLDQIPYLAQLLLLVVAVEEVTTHRRLHSHQQTVKMVVAAVAAEIAIRRHITEQGVQATPQAFRHRKEAMAEVDSLLPDNWLVVAVAAQVLPAVMLLTLMAVTAAMGLHPAFLDRL